MKYKRQQQKKYQHKKSLDMEKYKKELEFLS